MHSLAIEDEAFVQVFFYEKIRPLLMQTCPAQMLPPSHVSLTSPGYWLSSAMHAPRSMAPVTVTSSVGSGLSLPAPEYCTRAGWEMQATYTQDNAGCRLHIHRETMQAVAADDSLME
jgi:hypothetical protein